MNDQIDKIEGLLRSGDLGNRQYALELIEILELYNSVELRDMLEYVIGEIDMEKHELNQRHKDAYHNSAYRDPYSNIKLDPPSSAGLEKQFKELRDFSLLAKETLKKFNIPYDQLIFENDETIKITRRQLRKLVKEELEERKKRKKRKKKKKKKTKPKKQRYLYPYVYGYHDFDFHDYGYDVSDGGFDSGGDGGGGE